MSAIVPYVIPSFCKSIVYILYIILYTSREQDSVEIPYLGDQPLHAKHSLGTRDAQSVMVIPETPPTKIRFVV